LELKHRAKTVMRWLGAASVPAVACLCFFSIAGFAQDGANAPSTTAPAQKTSDANAAKAKRQAPSAVSGSKASSPASAKAHSASHPAVGTHPKSNAAATAHNSKYPTSRKGSRKKTARGQQKIDSERAQAIQEALIREHYMSGTATGTWNQSSEDAMRRYQADHGWQSKTVPDSRALISLGLGPSHDHLLNPESAMTTGPFPPRSESTTPASHSADPGTRLNTNPATPADPVPATSPTHDASVPQ
jgi:hypothetical protein